MARLCKGDIGEQIALLIAAADAKGINVNLWFGVDENNGLSESSAFDTKITSLAKIVGVDEDEETKRDLDIATSRQSLKNVRTLFGEETDGLVLVNVTEFISKCMKKVHELEMVGVFDQPIPEIASQSSSLDREDASSEDLKVDDDDDHSFAYKQAVQTYIDEAKQWAGEGVVRPISAPVGQLVDPRMIPSNGSNTPLDEISSSSPASSLNLPRSETPPLPLTHDDDAKDNVVMGLFGPLDRPKEVDEPRFTSNPGKKSRQESHLDRMNRSTENAIHSKSTESSRRRSTGSSNGVIRSASAPRETGVSRAPTADPRTSSVFTSTRRASSSQNFRSLTRKSIQWQLENPEQLAQLKEHVREEVVHAVKQADLYHLVQVHFGFVKSYTLVPPRGEIVRSKERKWLSSADLRVAFLAARLKFTETHIAVFKELVKDFASTKASEHEFVEQTAGSVTDQGRLSSEWTRKYLIYLRLAKRKSTTGPIPPSQEQELESNGGEHTTPPEETKQHLEHDEREPIPWDNWMIQKREQDKTLTASKAAQFQKALDGKKHSLSGEEVNEFVEKCNLLPAELLEKEIDLAVESWVLDANGRRDFSHSFNVEVKKWQKENGTMWSKLRPAKRNQMTEDIRGRMLNEKKRALMSAEKSFGSITKELFHRYQLQRRENDSWAKWVVMNQQKTEKTLSGLRDSIKERTKAVAVVAAEKKSVALLRDIEAKLDAVSKTVSPVYSMELRKRLVALRKTAMLTSKSELGNGNLVTRKDFDQHFHMLLTAHPTAFPPELLPAESGTKTNELFHHDLEEVARKMIETEAAEKQKIEEDFSTWKQAKLTETTAKKKRQKESLCKKEEEAVEKKKVAEKAYKKWLKAHKKNKYISKVDGKCHPLPTTVPSVVKHKQSWRGDVPQGRLCDP